MASCLAWNGSHINFEKEEIFVGQSLSGIKEDGSPIIEKPKTKSSRRFIPISAELVHQLRKWKLASPKSPWKLVFCQADSKPLHRKSTWNISNAAMRKADLKIIRVHDLRHTFATIHLSHGTPAIELLGLLGHSSFEMTLRVYCHFDPAQRTRNSTNVFTAAVYGSEKSIELASSK